MPRGWSSSSLPSSAPVRRRLPRRVNRPNCTAVRRTLDDQNENAVCRMGATSSFGGMPDARPTASAAQWRRPDPTPSTLSSGPRLEWSPRRPTMLIAPLVLALFPSSPPARGEPFADLAYQPALAKAQAEKKLLLVDFTASWCGPCKKMEKDTWAASEVRAWIGENAIAIQIDVDEERVLAQRFRIEAMPTVVAVRDGQEFDRAVGYRNASQFLAWSRDVRAGKRASDALVARSKELRESTDVDARYKAARELAQIGQNDEALAHYLWLWPATRSESGYGGARLSVMRSDIARLAQKHEPARKAFEEIFAGLQAKVDAAEVPSFADWQEWTAFCRYFGGNGRIVAWYEKHRDEEGQLLAGQND